MTKDDENFFEKFGLGVQPSPLEDLQIGQVYPIYGMITAILSDDPGSVMVEINFNIKATMLINEEDKINTIKGRSFEPGIFVLTVDSIADKDSIRNDKYNVEGTCNTVIFGRKNEITQ